ncbi:MAG: hypothetical protein FWG87_08010 [Defluviitaleaceae bacterium]|nr:hypothetical protein [Defluviitaleaceae bacterium]
MNTLLLLLVVAMISSLGAKNIYDVDSTSTASDFSVSEATELYNLENCTLDMEVTYNGNPVSSLLGRAKSEVVVLLSIPDEYLIVESVPNNSIASHIYYDGIDLYFRSGYFATSDIYNVNELKINDISMNVDRAEIIRILGSPIEEGFGEGCFDGDAYLMYTLPSCEITFHFSNVYAPADRVRISQIL